MMKVVNESKKIAGKLYLPLFYPLLYDEVRALDEQYYINEGAKKPKYEMIINLFKNNVPLNIIMKSSGLSKKEVKKIIDSLKE